MVKATATLCFELPNPVAKATVTVSKPSIRLRRHRFVTNREIYSLTRKAVEVQHEKDFCFFRCSGFFDVASFVADDINIDINDDNDIDDDIEHDNNSSSSKYNDFSTV